MASGSLDLAYLIEISIVFNLAYRELNHNSLLKKIDDIRDKVNSNDELQAQLSRAKGGEEIADETLTKEYNLFSKILQCVDIDTEECKKENSALNKSWEGRKKDCKYFVKNILKERAKTHTAWAIIITMLILVFATTSSHFDYQKSNGLLWVGLFFTLIWATLVPIYHLVRSTKVANYLLGHRYNKRNGRIETLQKDFTKTYNKYTQMKADKQTFK